MAQPLASSVSSGLERQIRGVLSAVLALSLFELTANSFAQRDVLNEFSTVLFVLLVTATLTSVFQSWFFGPSNVIFVVHGLLVGASLALWPQLLVDANAFPSDFKPWIWWTLGIGILSFGLFVRWWLAGIYSVLICIGWFMLSSSAFGGSAGLLLALQDSVYLFLFGGSLLGMINLVRRGAKRADDANTSAIKSAIEQARIDAVERERQRLDALIHDRVLNTLLVAAKAKTKTERIGAKRLAENAISSLQEALIEPRSNPSVTPLGLFRALRKAALQLVPEIEVRTLGGGSEEIPAEQAQAITQATLQAIDNAARHSKATSYELVLDSPSQSEIEITVRDNGVGFRLDRVPKARIGLRTSVIGRMHVIEGVAEISTAPGQGTEIKLRWPK